MYTTCACIMINFIIILDVLIIGRYKFVVTDMYCSHLNESGVNH